MFSEIPDGFDNIYYIHTCRVLLYNMRGREEIPVRQFKNTKKIQRKNNKFT